MRHVLPIGLLLIAASAAHAEPDAVQIGDHPTFGRLVVELGSAGKATLVQRRDKLEISLPGETVSTPLRVPRNVIDFAGGLGRVTVTVAPGARVKSVQNGQLLIIDVLDPASRSRNGTPSSVNRANPVWTAPVPVRAAAAPVPAPPAPPVASPAPPPAAAPAPPPQPAEAQAPNPPAAEPSKPAAIHVAASPDIGAVAFRRGDLAVIVFDDRLELNNTADDPLPEGANVQQMQGATILVLPIAENEALAMSRDRDGWVLDIGPPNATPAAQTQAPDGIAFQFTQPGRALTISDPVTGQTLLLGTLRQAGHERTLIDARRAATGYVLLPTWLGLALEVTSDDVDLRASHAGFLLKIPDRAASGTAATATKDNQFGIPNADTQVLLRRLDGQIASAATSPPRGRGAERIAAARTMLALGMAAEAQALLSLAANDDPNLAADPRTAALSGIAAVLAQRPGEAAGLDDPNLPASGDIALWRSLRDIEQGKTALSLGNFWPTLARYPAAVRQRVGPTVLEAAIDAGEAVPASELEGPAFAFARALQKQRSGDIDAALDQFDAIAKQHDERDSVRAAVAATELRLSKDKITPALAADQIERQTLRWRGNNQELTMRLRVAELRTLAGQWRSALESLRQTETLSPDVKERIVALKSGVFTLMLFAKTETLNPLEMVALVGDFADCIPEGKDGERVAALLAEKLVALDLPSRAIPVLQHLIDSTTAPGAKTEFALRLARLQLDAGDPAQAESVLAAIDPGPLEHDTAEQRLLLLARARAGRGDPAGAATLLADMDTPASIEMRASYLAKAGDWAASLQALQKLAASTVPETGDLTDQQQDLVMREVTAAVQAGDTPAVRDLRRFDARIKPPRTDIFRLLTQNPVDSPDDLPRAARELASSRALPERLNALKLR